MILSDKVVKLKLQYPSIRQSTVPLTICRSTVPTCWFRLPSAPSLTCQWPTGGSHRSPCYPINTLSGSQNSFFPNEFWSMGQRGRKVQLSFFPFDVIRRSKVPWSVGAIFPTKFNPSFLSLGWVSRLRGGAGKGYSLTHHIMVTRPTFFVCQLFLC